MIKDAFYREACEDAKEMAAHGYHWTDEVVENRAISLALRAEIENREKEFFR